MSHITTPETFTPKCTMATVWAGFKDWYLERCYGPAPGMVEAPSTTPPVRSVLWLFISIPLVLVLLGGLTVLLAPTLVAGLSLAGDAAVANTTMLLSSLLGLTFVLGIPYLILRRLFRFGNYCCIRGHALATGDRVPVTRQASA